MAPLFTLLHLPALDCAHDAPAPGWCDAFTPAGPLAGRRPDLIVVTGLARAGRPAELDRALALLQHLIRPFDAHPPFIWPVPGPGDRDATAASPLLALAGALPAAQLFDGGTTAQLMIEPFAAWTTARQRIIGGGLTAKSPCLAQPLTLGDHPVALLGLNSAWLPGDAPIAAVAAAGHGLDGLLARQTPALVIAALHHPPASLRADERAAIEALLARCDLVLHDTAAAGRPGPPPLLGVAPGLARWIEVYPNHLEATALDLRAGLKPTSAPTRLPFARPIALAATTTSADDGPPDLASYLRHLARDWGRVLLHGLVESGATDESQPVGEVYVSLRVDAPRVSERRPKPGAELRGRSLAVLRDVLREPRSEPRDARLTATLRDLLAARALPHDPGSVTAARRRLARVAPDADDRHLEAALTAWDVEQAIAAHRWLLIEGDPGTGKSTTVQAVVMALVDALAYPEDPVRTAPARALGFAPPWPVPLPIYCRQFWSWVLDGRSRDDGRAGDALLVDYLRHQLGRHAGGDAWIRPLLDAGRALLVFDGLDEMPWDDPDAGWDGAHQRAITTVHDAATRFAHNRGLVTSRPAGLVRGIKDTLIQAGLRPFTLRLLAPDQIEAFVGRWYGCLLNAEAARVEADDLLERIRRAELDELAQVPITLVAMAIVHRNSRLPERRVELYEQCIKALLHRWHDRLTDRTVARWLCGPLSETAKLRVVEHLATLAHERAALDREPVLAAVYESLSEAQQAKHERPDDCAPLVETLSERSGLLVRDAGGWRWKFRHRVFQEYLAARHLCQEQSDNRALIERLDGLLGRPDWHGVVPLALAYKASNHRVAAADVLKALLARAAGRDDLAERLTATAVLARAARDLRHYELDGLAAVVEPWLRPWAEWIEHPDQHGAHADRVAVAEVLGFFGDPRFGWGPAQFVEVPAGEYIAGAVDGKVGPDDQDRDDHRVVAAFHIGRYLVTAAQFLEFVDHPAFADPRWWRAGDEGGDERARVERHWRAQPPNHPITAVSWYDAKAFCAWASVHHGGALGEGAFDLPTDDEWEKAARGGRVLRPGEPNLARERRYPWADDAELSPDRANYGHQRDGTTPVGLYPRGRGPYGALDQAGNVWEWCDPLVRADRGWRVLRGGAWRFDPQYLRVSYRFGGPPAVRSDVIGFRCVWRLAPESLGA